MTAGAGPTPAAGAGRWWPLRFGRPGRLPLAPTTWRGIVLALAASTAAAALAAYQPVVALATALLGLLCAGLWRRPQAIVFILIALVPNTKFNVFVGLLTVFPEYLPLAIATVVVGLHWARDGGRFEERNLVALFALLFLAGILSILNSVSPARVVSKAMLIPVAATVTWLVATLVRSERQLARAMNWFEITAFVVALYGIAQILGLFMHWDMGLRFLHRWGNPMFEYAVGAPVVRPGSYVFRSNSLFNDPNILGGYLAAAFAIVLALRIHHGDRPETRRRAAWETLVLGVLLLCEAFSMSRSGFLGIGAGTIVVLALNPRVARSPRFWSVLGIGVGAVLVFAALGGVKPGLIVWRMISSFDPADESSSTHLSVGLYALGLVARFPLTGVGLGNFGYYYGSEVNVSTKAMMSHNAILSVLAESGLLGGAAFFALVVGVGRRPWRALRHRDAAVTHPRLYAITAGLFGALVALFVSNLFYDYLLRDFVWVICGLAVAASRLWEAQAAKAPLP